MGQQFWELISGDDHLYIDLIEPIGYRAREHSELFIERRAELENTITRAFIERFCSPDGKINWEQLVEHNSRNRRTNDKN